MPVPTVSPRPAPLTGKIFRGADAIRAGLLTKNELRNPGWRRLFRGVYADATLPASHRQRCLAAARYLLPAPAAIAGRSAAWLYGITLADDAQPVEVLTPPAARFGPVHGLQIHVAPLPDHELRMVGGVRCTNPLRTAWDLACWLPLPDAVAYLDLMIKRRLVTTSALQEYARAGAGRRGWRKLRRAVSLADPAAESPQESRMRVRLVLAGLPQPVSQHVIEGRGRFLARVDLAWPSLKVAIEYDGRWHTDPARLEVDRARLNGLLAEGWIVLHLTARRMRDDFEGFLAEVRTVLQQRRRRPSRA